MNGSALPLRRDKSADRFDNKIVRLRSCETHGNRRADCLFAPTGHTVCVSVHRRARQRAKENDTRVRVIARPDPRFARESRYEKSVISSALSGISVDEAAAAAMCLSLSQITAINNPAVTFARWRVNLPFLAHGADSRERSAAPRLPRARCCRARALTVVHFTPVN